MRGNVVRGGVGLELDEPRNRVSDGVLPLPLFYQPVKMVYMPITEEKFLVVIVSSRVLILQHFLQDILVFFIQLELVAIFAEDVDTAVVIPERKVLI